jgi:heterodisulfide reductase subunit C
VKRLTKGIEESKKDREKLSAETEKMMSMFKEIEKKAFVVQEEYKKTQEVYVLSHCTSGCPPPQIYLHFLMRVSLFVFT